MNVAHETFIALLLSCLLVVGCGHASPDDATADAAVPVDEAASLDLADRADDAGTQPCADAEENPPDGGVCVISVEADVVDEQGAPVPELVVSVCGSECYFDMTDASGHASVPVGAHVLLATYSLLLHARPARAGYYTPLPPLEGGIARYTTPLRLASLPATGPVVALDGSAQSLLSGDVTLTISAGATIEPNVEDVNGTDPIYFRTLRVSPGPADLAPAFLDDIAPAMRPTVLYAITPYEALITGATDGAQLSFANSAALPNAAALDVLGLGSLTNPDPTAPLPGTLGIIGQAHVSADGTRINLDPGTTIDFLTWIGLRAK